jgi:hypothetical protein
MIFTHIIPSQALPHKLRKSKNKRIKTDTHPINKNNQGKRETCRVWDGRGKVSKREKGQKSHKSESLGKESQSCLCFSKGQSSFKEQQQQKKPE